MIRDEVVVKRYADAYVELAGPDGAFEKCLADLNILKTVLRENPGFLGFLRNPEITFLEKGAFIDRTMVDDFSSETKDLIKLLLDKKRIDKLPDIIDYIRIKYSHEGVEEAVLKTSFPVDLDLVRVIKEGVEKKFRKKFKFYIDLDAELMGGIQVTIGHTVIDGSVKRRLDDLKEKLDAVRV